MRVCESSSLENGFFEGEAVVVKVDIAEIGIVFKLKVILAD